MLAIWLTACFERVLKFFASSFLSSSTPVAEARKQLPADQKRRTMATATATLPGRARRQQLSDIVNESLPTVRFLASRLASRIPPHVDVDDLVQVGLMGLLKSADRFDPRRGVKFQTYASRRVQGAMLDYLRSLDWKPRSVRTRRRKLEKAYHDAEQRLGGRASEEDVAQEIGISLPELESWMGNSVGSPAWSQTEECISEETLE